MFIRFMHQCVPSTRSFVAVILLLIFGSQALAFSETAEQLSQSVLLDITAQHDHIIAVGERGHILVSNDGGSSWEVGTSPVAQSLTAVFMLDSKRAWAVGHDGIIISTEDGGYHWQLQHSHQLHADKSPEDELGFGPLMGIWFANADEGIAVGAFGQMLLTHDGGRQWYDASDRLNNIDGYHLNAIIPAGEERLLIAAEAGMAFLSDDGGKAWSRYQMPEDGSLFGAWYQETDESLYLFGLQGLIYRSKDNGERWQQIKTDLNTAFYEAFSDTQERIHFVGGDGMIFTLSAKGQPLAQYQFSDRRIITAGTQVSVQFFLTGQAGLQPVHVDEVVPVNSMVPLAEMNKE